MEFKGTKGEWKVVNDNQVYFSQEDFDIKDCDLYEHQYDSFSEMAANAKLIAAAPELLKALTRCVERLDENGFGDTFAVSKAREAINKALK